MNDKSLKSVVVETIFSKESSQILRFIKRRQSHSYRIQTHESPLNGALHPLFLMNREKTDLMNEGENTQK